MASRFRERTAAGRCSEYYQNILFLYPERKGREASISLPEVVFSWDGYFLKNNDLYVLSYAKMKEVFGIL
ncbi:hypothetical protein DW150_19210 [Phocaeicola vulgatus]|uniref:Uncharacterized protein n=1 Tax=Phocaeicola vulgatus TaxID=821 RepID=A0A415BJ59_PHOVU|nr:hypothetical protein DW150_19210 [Phocaeicola vulgatus]